MSIQLIQVASGNAGKLGEIMLGVELWRRQKLLRLDATIELLPGFALLPKCIEDAASYAGNARKKALHYFQHSAQHLGRHAPLAWLAQSGPAPWVLADDSGLVVDALAGAPGVYSARYAGPNATDADNNQKLLRELTGVPPERRTARFVCALALAAGDAIIAEFSGTAEGRIITAGNSGDAPRGAHGFGYDPLFLDAAHSKTYAELTAEEKLQRSHRGHALFALLDWLAQRG